MRSELVFEALAHTSNRYELCKLLSKGSREFHRPRTRLEDTTNGVLVLLGRTTPATASWECKQLTPLHPVATPNDLDSRVVDHIGGIY